MAVLPHPDKLSGKTVLLFAGTSDIGKALASALVSRNVKVILTSTRQTKLDDTISQLSALYPNAPTAKGFVLNLLSQDLEQNLRDLVDDFHRNGVDMIHHLVYLAGESMPPLNLEAFTREAWSKVTQVRIVACLTALKYLVSFIRAAGPASVQGSPSIVLTGGSVADKPIPGGWVLGAMIGSALQGAARQLALDLKPIRVNTVAPGVVDTAFWDQMDEQAKSVMMRKMEETMPTGRMGNVQDVVEAYLWAMCDGNVTGEAIRTNSGVLLV